MSIFDFTFFKILRAWYQSTESCSAYSHALMYAVLVSSVLIAVGGVFVWRRFIRTQPGKPLAKNMPNDGLYSGSVG